MTRRTAAYRAGVSQAERFGLGIASLDFVDLTDPLGAVAVEAGTVSVSENRSSPWPT